MAVSGSGDYTLQPCLRYRHSEDYVRRLAAQHGFTIRELAECVLRLTGSKSRIEYRPLPADDPLQRRPDIGRARQRLDWQPGIALEDGLKETIAHFRKQVNA